MLKKRAMSILIVALLATACGGSSEPADTAASDTEPAETVESTETEPVETTTTSEAAEPEPEPEPEPEEEPDADPALLDGSAIYATNCASCHGPEGQGARGPKLEGLADKRPDKAPIIAIVTNGGRTMPDFAEKLSEAEIVAVVDFVHTAWPAPAES